MNFRDKLGISLIFIASIIETADEQLLPAVYRHVGRDLNATIVQLSGITFGRTLVQAAFSPVSGLLGIHRDRARLLATGCLLWGFTTATFGSANSLALGTLVWGCNGIGLALVQPTAVSLIADLVGPEWRGKAFGLQQFLGNTGAMLGSSATAALAGVYGWRTCFYLMAASSLGVSAATFLVARDPRTVHVLPSTKTHDGEVKLTWRNAVQSVKEVVTVPTFLVIIAQGAVGSVPWVALSWLILYFQLQGFPDGTAGLLNGIFLASCGFGGIIGGTLGDWAARRLPVHGRIFVAQASVLLGMPLTWVLFRKLPGASTWAHAACLVALGMTCTWTPAACNNPVFADVVPVKLRSLIYALDRCFEMAIASAGAPLVGWMAKNIFGFAGVVETHEDSHSTDTANAAALANAMCTTNIMFWVPCFVLYSLMHRTYPGDSLEARQGKYKLASLTSSRNPAFSYITETS